MASLKMFCLDLHNSDYDKISSIGYTPVGLGDAQFDNRWIRDNTLENISTKNKKYGEYTFHYWVWKNMLKEIEDNTWIGFCAYRRFWSQNKDCRSILTKNDMLRSIPEEWNKNSVILGQHIFMDGWTLMKIVKHGLKPLLKDPKFIFEKNRNLKFHFDSYHGATNLTKAIELLDKNERKDFHDFMNNNNSFNRGNMFICNSKKMINDYYESIFPWLKRCEKIFGLDVKGEYGSDRIYGFLAERYMSYWFNKYSKVTVWPIIFYDINKNELK
tara:strand:- start:633 stop:1445 length:813 start_codon:yes stop_codon:yes gene_type:complete